MPGPLVRLAKRPVSDVKGVGEVKAKSLNAVGVFSVFDLLTYYPRRYLDRTREARISDLAEGEEAMVVVEVESVSSRPTRNRRKMVEVKVSDGQSRLKISFFNQPWRERQLTPGTQAVLFGKLENFRGTRQMTNPVVDLIGNRTGRIIPVYPQSEKNGVNSWDVGAWMEEILRRSGDFSDPVPQQVLDKYDLVDRTTAFRDVHLPESMAAANAARRRLVFDELFRVQLELVQRKWVLEDTTAGLVHEVGGGQRPACGW